MSTGAIEVKGVASQKNDVELTADIDLLVPVDANGQRFERVTMRRPKVKDMIESANGAANDSDNELNLIAVLTGINPEDLKEFDGSDYLAMQDKLKGFLYSRPGNSGKPS